MKMKLLWKKNVGRKWLFWKKNSSKETAALKKEVLWKGNPYDTLKKITLKKYEEVPFPKIKLSENIATYAGREIAIDTYTYSLGISYEYLTGWR